jgi:O-antigen ligase
MRRALNYGILFFLFSLPFGTKKFIAPFIPQLFDYAREFSSLFIYATDIIALAVFIIALWYGGRRLFSDLILKWYGALAMFGLVSPIFAVNSAYSFYIAVSLIIALVGAMTVAFAIREKIVAVRAVVITLGASATVQAIIAIVQFYYQKSIGLSFLGEAVITPTTTGVARVTIEGLQYLRAYGTLPHANILAGFLIMGFISCVYGYLTTPRERVIERVAIATSIFIILVALIFTFSRSGWLVAGLCACVIGIYAFWKEEFRIHARALMCVAVISFVALSATLGWAIVPRAGFVKGEASIDHRVYYNEIGITLIREHPLGVGLGSEVLTAGSEGLFAHKGLMQKWLWQPVHNIYILIASELGILGLVIFLALLFIGFRRIKLALPETVFAGILVASLLLFGCVDHFPWDLHAGRLMLWTTFAILVAV